MVWCQGESDGDSHTEAKDYRNRFEDMLSSVLLAGIEMCFLITIGKYNGTKQMDYEEIIRIQHKIAIEHSKVFLASDDFESMKDRGLMKDAFHYYQAAYNEVGMTAGRKVAKYVCGRGK